MPHVAQQSVSEGLCSHGSSTCTIGCACSLPDAAFPEPGFKLHSSFKHRSSLNQANRKENQHSVFTTPLNYKNKLKNKINANTSLTSGQQTKRCLDETRGRWGQREGDLERFPPHTPGSFLKLHTRPTRGSRRFSQWWNRCWEGPGCSWLYRRGSNSRKGPTEPTHSSKSMLVGLGRAWLCGLSHLP